MAESIPGHECKVANLSNQILGMGVFTLPLGTLAELDDTEFGDDWMKRKYGIRDGGSVTFNGNFKLGDTTGQDVIHAAFLNKTELTDIRFYVGSSSYFAPCRTTGYVSPSQTTGGPTQISHMVITASEVGADKSQLVTRSFTGQMTGCLVLH
jgi:hypothetical protein